MTVKITKPVFVVLSMLLVVLAGCSDDEPASPYVPPPNPVTDFVDYCYGPDVDVEALSVDARLVFDTLNLPTANAGINKLVLGVDPASPFGHPPFLEFFFAETLDESIDPGLAMERGWKVRLQGVSAEKCAVCYTDNGLARVISLHGSIENVVFEYDPQDTLALYVRPTSLP